MITFSTSTEVSADRRVVLTLPPETPLGKAELVVSVAPQGENESHRGNLRRYFGSVHSGDLRSADNERIDADLCGLIASHTIEAARCCSILPDYCVALTPMTCGMPMQLDSMTRLFAVDAQLRARGVRCTCPARCLPREASLGFVAELATDVDVDLI